MLKLPFLLIHLDSSDIIYFGSVDFLKMDPYSFTNARALRTNQVICARSKETLSVFLYFITSIYVNYVNFLAFSSVISVKFGRLLVNILF